MEIVRDGDRVGVRVTATLDSRAEGSDGGLRVRVNILFRGLRLGWMRCAAHRKSEENKDLKEGGRKTLNINSRLNITLWLSRGKFTALWLNTSN